MLTWMRDNVLYHKDELMMEENAPDIFKVLDKLWRGCRPAPITLSSPPGFTENARLWMTVIIRASLFNLSWKIIGRHSQGCF